MPHQAGTALLTSPYDNDNQTIAHRLQREGMTTNGKPTASGFLRLTPTVYSVGMRQGIVITSYLALMAGQTPGATYRHYVTHATAAKRRVMTVGLETKRGGVTKV